MRVSEPGGRDWAFRHHQRLNDWHQSRLPTDRSTVRADTSSIIINCSITCRVGTLPVTAALRIGGAADFSVIWSIRLVHRDCGGSDGAKCIVIFWCPWKLNTLRDGAYSAFRDIKILRCILTWFYLSECLYWYGSTIYTICRYTCSLERHDITDCRQIKELATVRKSRWECDENFFDWIMNGLGGFRVHQMYPKLLCWFW